PVIAATLYGLAGLDAAIAVDLITFAIAYIALACFIKMPDVTGDKKDPGNVIQLAKEGLKYLKQNPMILYVILFLSGVNLIASAFNATLPALIIPNPRGGNSVLGIVSSCSGVAMAVGSLIAMNMPKPKDRIKVIYLTMLFSLGTENFILAFSRSPLAWCIAEVLGWIFVPVMNTNQNVIMRNSIPVELQGRVYACRNTLQFFTIPIGLLFGGFMVDEICEPFMAAKSGIWINLFGSGKGSGAALMMFILAITGVIMCLAFGNRLSKYHYSD
ncbi:MAG: MFS transporter, partial [Lachnospiraceae bacterium]|nr:MFS transporter [Lachnospiraceae bacterium]